MHRFVSKSPVYPLACRFCNRVASHENHYPPPERFRDAVPILQDMMNRSDVKADTEALRFAVLLLGKAR